jgi:hypothetical protein
MIEDAPPPVIDGPKYSPPKVDATTSPLFFMWATPNKPKINDAAKKRAQSAPAPADPVSDVSQPNYKAPKVDAATSPVLAFLKKKSTASKGAVAKVKTTSGGAAAAKVHDMATSSSSGDDHSLPRKNSVDVPMPTGARDRTLADHYGVSEDADASASAANTEAINMETPDSAVEAPKYSAPKAHPKSPLFGSLKGKRSATASSPPKTATTPSPPPKRAGTSSPLSMIRSPRSNKSSPRLPTVQSGVELSELNLADAATSPLIQSLIQQTPDGYAFAPSVPHTFSAINPSPPRSPSSRRSSISPLFGAGQFAKYASTPRATSPQSDQPHYPAPRADAATSPLFQNYTRSSPGGSVRFSSRPPSPDRKDSPDRKG